MPAIPRSERKTQNREGALITDKDRPDRFWYHLGRSDNRQLDAFLTGNWTLDDPRFLAVPLVKL